jgi:ribosomal protein S18 acetylase RimI-like enzyme
MSRFRQAQRGDADAIAAMMQAYYAEDGYPFDRDQAMAAIHGLIGDAHYGRLWVAEVDGAVVGYLAVTLGFSLEYRGRDAFIDELYIDVGSRGIGLGREAMALAEAYCRAEGVRALHLEVEIHRDAAYSLYAGSGFERHERHLMTRLLETAPAPAP